MAQGAKNKKMSSEKMKECFIDWLAHASKGNSYNLICNMINYYKSIGGIFNGESNKSRRSTINFKK